MSYICALCGLRPKVGNLSCKECIGLWEKRPMPGFFRHYKGGVYFVHGLAVRDASEVYDVVYSSVQSSAERENGMTFRTRTIADFVAEVRTNPNGKDGPCAWHHLSHPDEKCTCWNMRLRFTRMEFGEIVVPR